MIMTTTPSLSILMKAIPLIPNLEQFQEVQKFVGRDTDNEGNNEDASLGDDDNTNGEDDAMEDENFEDDVEEDEDDVLDDEPQEMGDEDEDSYQPAEGDVEDPNMDEAPSDLLVGTLLENVLAGEEFQEILAQKDNFDQITIAVDTEWIKCACGSLKFGVRFEQTSDQQHQQQYLPITVTWDFLGGTHTDRTHVGDTFFWEAVQTAAPSITGDQWTEFVQDPARSDVLVIEPTEEDDDDDDDNDNDSDNDQGDNDNGIQHRAYPDIFKRIFIKA